MEQAIIAACIDSREAFNVVEALDASHDLSPNGIELYKHIAAYYKRDKEAQCVDVSVLLKTIETKKPFSYEKLSMVIEDLPEASPSNIIELLTEQRLLRIGTELTACFSSGDKDKAASLVQEYADVYQLGITSEQEADELFDVYQGTNLRELTKELRDGSDLCILPDLLGDIVYNMLPGDHVVVFGQVNRGKSAVVINAACDYAYEGKRVLYIGNEDPAKRMLIRIVCNLCGVPLSEAEEDEEYYTDMARDNGYDNIIFKELSPGSMEDVERLCEHFKPDICIIDQARNIVPKGKQGSEESQAGAIMYQLRMLYKRLKIVGVSVTQAGEKDIYGKPMENRMKLSQNDVFGSKASVAMQADVMIGIGATPAMVERGQLYLNVCKNKASGVHEGVLCFIDPQTSSVKSD